jgi:cation diffusion facilitator family transporter
MSSSQIGAKEKNLAAQSSVIAAIALTAFKLITSLATNSLGILAEAAHSGLDLVAALITLMAVRFSSKPADFEHHYGHGKIENISALFETLLLLLTCAWITYESVQRLFFQEIEVTASFWAFLVMIISIAIDYTRSKVLYRTARKYNSQALEADALHFSTDIWSSSVVILGLIGVVLAGLFPGLAFLRKADAGAALLVAIIVIYVSLQLGRRTVKGLLDSAPIGFGDRIRQEVEKIPGIYSCHKVRVRMSGAECFIDLHVNVGAGQPLKVAHDLTEQVEEAVKRLTPDADVTVHAEPKQRVVRARENFHDA